MIDLAFSVQRHILTRTDNTTITTNSKQIHRVIFSFSSEWEGTEKAAVFRQGSMSFNIILDENDSCVIPGEVLISDRAVDIHVSVYGIKDNTTITSTVVVVHAEMGSKTGGEVSSITPTLFEQIMSKLAEINAGQVDEGKISEAVEGYLSEHPTTVTVTAEDVTAAVENYVAANRDSLKGDKGDKGSKGDKGNPGNNGKSAYEIACDNGYTGTEAEWIASLGGSGEGIDLSEYAKKSDIAEISEYFEEPEFTQVSFEAIKREYISNRGIIAGNVSSDGWQHSTPIAVSKGDTIKLHASGYATNVAMISTCDFNGENIIPRVVSEYSESGDVWNYKDYYFTVPDAGYIMISYSTTPGQAILYIRGAAGREKMSQRIEQLFQASINSNLCHIFKKVICIGDSYTEGYMSVDDGSATVHKEYSWVEYMAQITGNNWINRAVSGTTADTWLSHKNGFAKVESDGKAQAYVIGLGINDSREENSQKLLALGTPDDIGTETVSYYGRLAKIIVKLAEINPDAIILVNTCPLYYAFERISPYNEAVRTIVNHYKDTYRIHCIDLADTYHDLYFDATYTRDYSSSHPTALGQAKMAKMYEYVLSDYMNKHPKAFDDIPWIPYV